MGIIADARLMATVMAPTVNSPPITPAITNREWLDFGIAVDVTSDSVEY